MILWCRSGFMFEKRFMRSRNLNARQSLPKQENYRKAPMPLWSNLKNQTQLQSSEYLWGKIATVAKQLSCGVIPAERTDWQEQLIFLQEKMCCCEKKMTQFDQLWCPSCCLLLSIPAVSSLFLLSIKEAKMHEFGKEIPVKLIALWFIKLCTMFVWFMHNETNN